MSGVQRTGALRRVWGVIGRHRVLSIAFALLAVAVVVLGDLVGLNVLISVGLLALIGGLAVVIGRRWLARRDGSSPAVVLGSVAIAAVVVALAIQLIPFGRAHSNGEITGEPAWADDATRDLMVRACYDCHSNEVEYPWYASVAPVSWAVELHVNQGRNHVNYSTFATDPGDADESVEVVLDGSMPPGYFTRFGLHPEAKLTDAELEVLVQGLRATPGMTDEDDRDDRDD